MSQKVCFSFCDIAGGRADLLRHGFLLKVRQLYGFWVCKSFYQGAEPGKAGENSDGAGD